MTATMEVRESMRTSGPLGRESRRRRPFLLPRPHGVRPPTRPHHRGLLSASSLGIAVFVLSLGLPGTAWGVPAQEIYHGPPEARQIALTFDDNSLSERALPTLRILKQYKVPATMFVIGYLTENYPEITREIADGVRSGLFEVGDHTRSHRWLDRLSTSAVRAQIGGGTDAFRRTTGMRTVPLFRPPGAFKNSTVRAVAGTEGFPYLVMWDIDPRDWAGKSAKAIEDVVLGNAHPGAIVVMHLCGLHTAEALPAIITTLRAQRYELVTVSAMLKGTRAFLDVDERDDSGAAIVRLTRQGYMTGYDENYFGPDDRATASQVTSVLLRAGQSAIPAGRPLAESDLAEVYAGGSSSGITPLELAHALARMARQLKGYPQSPAVIPAGPPGVFDSDARLVGDLRLLDPSGLRDSTPVTRATLAQAVARYLALPPYWVMLFSQWRKG